MITTAHLIGLDKTQKEVLLMALRNPVLQKIIYENISYAQNAMMSLDTENDNFKIQYRVYQTQLQLMNQLLSAMGELAVMVRSESPETYLAIEQGNHVVEI